MNRTVVTRLCDDRIEIMTITLERLELCNYRLFAGRHVIDFAPGLTSIRGDHASGKTTIAEAIAWVLCDDPDARYVAPMLGRERLNGELEGHGDAMAAVSIRVEKTPITVTRTLGGGRHAAWNHHFPPFIAPLFFSSYFREDAVGRAPHLLRRLEARDRRAVPGLFEEMHARLRGTGDPEVTLRLEPFAVRSMPESLQGRTIVNLALAWALAKASRAELPFIYDEPLGIFDLEHRRRVEEHLLRGGDQVLALSRESIPAARHYEIEASEFIAIASVYRR